MHLTRRDFVGDVHRRRRCVHSAVATLRPAGRRRPAHALRAAHALRLDAQARHPAWGEPASGTCSTPARPAAGRTSTGASSTPAGRPTTASCSAAATRPRPTTIFNPQNDADRAVRQKLLADSRRSAPPRSSSSSRRWTTATFDSLAAAIDYGHKIGLKIHAWATINEDDHGWGWRERVRQGPSRVPLGPPRRPAVPLAAQLRVPRSPRVQARAHRRAARRTTTSTACSSTGSAPATSATTRRPTPPASPTAATKQPNIDAFKTAVRHRSARRAQRRRALGPPPRRAANAVHARRPRAACAQAPQAAPDRRDGRPPLALPRPAWTRIDGNLRGLLLDVTTWANEGLIDAAIAAGYYRAGGTPREAYKALAEETGGKVDLWYYAWVPQNVGRVRPRLQRRHSRSAPSGCSSGKPTTSTTARTPPR